VPKEKEEKEEEENVNNISKRLNLPFTLTSSTFIQFNRNNANNSLKRYRAFTILMSLYKEEIIYSINK